MIPIESHGPDIHIKSETTGEMSKKRILKVATTQGSSGLNFLCFTNSILPTTVSWRLEGFGTLPSGVKEHHNLTRSSNLVWTRLLSYVDSGQYFCTASNKNGNNTEQLELLVRREYSLFWTVVPEIILLKGARYSSSQVLLRALFLQARAIGLGLG